MRINNKLITNQKDGFAPIAIILFGAILFIILSAGAYYFLRNSGKLPGYQNSEAYTTPSPVSENDETKTIENELENTNSGSVELDLKEIDSSASSL